jgi:hypothetical protein
MKLSLATVQLWNKEGIESSMKLSLATVQLWTAGSSNPGTDLCSGGVRD